MSKGFRPLQRFASRCPACGREFLALTLVGLTAAAREHIPDCATKRIDREARADRDARQLEMFGGRS